jgi:hypothetical protein
MPSNTTVDKKGSKSVHVKTTGHEELRITTMLLVVADGRKLTPFVILKRKNLLKKKPPPGLCEGESINKVKLHFSQTYVSIMYS